ncbi:hypothetical protein HK096_004236, partial [Nowakowskiella sp. JEL0078]
MQFWGIYTWSEKMDENETVTVRGLPLLGYLGTIVCAAALTIAFYYEIPAFAIAIIGNYVYDGLPVPWILDAMTNGLNITAQILLIMRFWEQWILWSIVNVLQITMYAGVGGFGVNINIILMWAFFLVNSLSGLYTWFQLWRTQVPSNEIDASGHLMKEEDELPQKPQPGEKSGLIIGKFYPFHVGHKFLINNALTHVDKLVVILCYKLGENPEGKVRLQAMKETFANEPKVTLLFKFDIYNTDDSKLWAELSRSWLGYIPDYVFTAEEYGDPWASYLGSKHIRVARNPVISGTDVRDNVYGKWDYLPIASKLYFKKRIVVIGPESTGKTTLVKDLAEYFKCPFVNEYGRTYTDMKIEEYKMKKNSSEEDEHSTQLFISVDWEAADFIRIAEEQENLIEKAIKSTDAKFVIADTDSFATQVWFERYLFEETLGKSSIVEESSVVPTDRAMLTDLYILCNPDVPFVQDNTRDGEAIRKVMYETFLQKLERERRNY